MASVVAQWCSKCFGSFTRAVVVKHARDNGNQRRCKVWRRYSGKGRHQNDWEVQVSCYQSMLRHSRGPRPPLEVSSRSEKSSCCGGMNILLLNRWYITTWCTDSFVRLHSSHFLSLVVA